MIQMTAEDEDVMREIRKMERDSFRRQVIELRASGVTVQAMATRFGISEAAMGQRIRRMGLADQKQAEAVREGIRNSGKRTGGAAGGHHHKAPARAGYLRTHSGECCFPGCDQRGYGKRQLCEPHRWVVIDREMLERSRHELAGDFKIDPWERNYDMCSDSPDVG
jgi:hypothetical protein